MKNPLGNMANLMKQAQAMQAQMAKLQEEAATKTVNGTAGGGMVSVTANGVSSVAKIAALRSSPRLQISCTVSSSILFHSTQLNSMGSPFAMSSVHDATACVSPSSVQPVSRITHQEIPATHVARIGGLVE